MLAASLQADAGDVRILLRVLVARLAEALGPRLQVERPGGLRKKKSEEIRRVTITLGNDELDAAVEGPALTCRISRSSGGIRIRSTTVSMQEWLARLLSGLQAEATTSEATRQALEAMMIGEGT